MSTKKITEYGLLLTVSLVFSYLESLLPVLVAVPGVKLGLANIVTMLVLYQKGGKAAFFLMTARVVLSGFLFSGPSGIFYGLAGGLLCIIVMGIARHFSCFSVSGVSMLGAVFHNLGQILVAFFVMENAHILYYFPVLCLTGMLSGIVIGYLSGRILKVSDKIFPQDFE